MEINWNAVSAIATSAAAVIALAIPSFIAWRKWRNTPSLRIDAADATRFSSEASRDNYCIRLPVHNDSGRRQASNVEVFVEAVLSESLNSLTVQSFAPMRLQWCHGVGPTCPSIPENSFRLLDLGYFSDWPLENTRPITILLAGEAPAAYRMLQPAQVYLLRLSISAEEMPTKSVTVKVTRLVEPAEGTPPVKIELA